MSRRYTLYLSDNQSAKSDVTEQVRSAGARVIAIKPGLALIDASDRAVRRLRSTLPDWQITEEHKAKIPKPRVKARRPRRHR